MVRLGATHASCRHSAKRQHCGATAPTVRLPDQAGCASSLAQRWARLWGATGMLCTTGLQVCGCWGEACCRHTHERQLGAGSSTKALLRLVCAFPMALPVHGQAVGCHSSALHHWPAGLRVLG